MQRAFARNYRFQGWKTFSPGLLFPFLFLAACQATPPPRDTAATVALVESGLKVPSDTPRFLVDPDASEIRLLVNRAGPLARFGHNHVISGRVRGEIRAGRDSAGSGFRIQVPVESLVVDPSEARAEEGEAFSAQVSAQARQATRENLLGKD